jgi:hypothetical protein
VDSIAATMAEGNLRISTPCSDLSPNPVKHRNASIGRRRRGLSVVSEGHVLASQAFARPANLAFLAAGCTTKIVNLVS